MRTPSGLTRLGVLAAANAHRGRALLHLDLAAALASDHVLASYSDLATFHIADSIVDTGDDGHEVLFLTAGDPPRVVVRVTFDADGNPLSERLNDTATPRQLVLISAKRTALAAETELGGGTYDAIVVPPFDDPPSNTPIEVYLVYAAVAGSDVVVADHRYLLVSADGTAALETTMLSHPDRVFLDPDRESARTIRITDSLGEVPSEIHMYLSFKHDQPMEVVTTPSNALWRLHDDDITFLGFLDVPSR